jgi:hypothetical protein
MAKHLTWWRILKIFGAKHGLIDLIMDIKQVSTLLTRAMWSVPIDGYLNTLNARYCWRFAWVGILYTTHHTNSVYSILRRLLDGQAAAVPVTVSSNLLISPVTLTFARQTRIPQVRSHHGCWLRRLFFFPLEHDFTCISLRRLRRPLKLWCFCLTKG